MQTKLTLRIDEEWILKAKSYAAREGRSVSELVAAYFSRLDSSATGTANTPDSKASTRKSRFYGLLKNQNLGQQVDASDLDKAAYRAHLVQKHQ